MGLSLRRALQRLHDFGRSRLQVSEMPRGALFGGHGSPDPKDVDRAVDASAIKQWHGDTGKSVVLRIAVVAADEARRTRSIASDSRLGEHLIDLFWISR